MPNPHVQPPTEPWRAQPAHDALVEELQLWLPTVVQPRHRAAAADPNAEPRRRAPAIDTVPAPSCWLSCRAAVDEPVDEPVDFPTNQPAHHPATTTSVRLLGRPAAGATTAAAGDLFAPRLGILRLLAELGMYGRILFGRFWDRTGLAQGSKN